MVYTCTDGLRVVNDMMAHFVTLKSICHVLAQSCSVFMSFCSAGWSAGNVISMYTRLSSAKRSMGDWMLVAISLMYRRKRSGPSMVPGGTPDNTSVEDEPFPLTRTRHRRWSRNPDIHA